MAGTKNQPTWMKYLKDRSGRSSSVELKLTDFVEDPKTGHGTHSGGQKLHRDRMALITMLAEAGIPYAIFEGQQGWAWLRW